MDPDILSVVDEVLQNHTRDTDFFEPDISLSVPDISKRLCGMGGDLVQDPIQ